MTMRSLVVALLPLLAATAATAADRPAKADLAKDDPNKVICKRESAIGSLVASKKVCLTRAEWATRRADAQSDTRRMQETTGGPQ